MPRIDVGGSSRRSGNRSSKSRVPQRNGLSRPGSSRFGSALRTRNTGASTDVDRRPMRPPDCSKSRNCVAHRSAALPMHGANCGPRRFFTIRYRDRMFPPRRAKLLPRRFRDSRAAMLLRCKGQAHHRRHWRRNARLLLFVRFVWEPPKLRCLAVHDPGSEALQSVLDSEQCSGLRPESHIGNTLVLRFSYHVCLTPVALPSAMILGRSTGESAMSTK